MPRKKFASTLARLAARLPETLPLPYNKTRNQMRRRYAIAALALLAACRSRPLPDLPQVSTASFSATVRENMDAALVQARRRPRDAAAVGRLGMSLHAHKQFDAARQCYMRASLLDPKSFDWRYYLGVVSEGQAAVDAL